MQNKLVNRIVKQDMIDWKKLVPFQPDNLKKTNPYTLQKLANSLCANGLTMNFYVWEKDGKIYIIDGHSRHEILQLLETNTIYPKDSKGKEHSVIIPDKFPCSFLDLKNKKEAKKAVLIFNSKYKQIDSDVLMDFTNDLELNDINTQIEIPELKLNLTTMEGLDDKFQLPDGDKAPFQQMTFTLANDQAIIIQNALTDIKKSEEYKYVETFGNENSNGNALYLLVSKCLM